jgi:N-acetylmuramoyl-L-alanine amidase CwlA
MNINRNYISNQNTYASNNPKYIVVHNTDNFSAGANALAHAKAQHNGNFSGMSAHYYVDDGATVYQAAEHSRGTWHCGKNYGCGRLFGTVSNRNSIGVEMCVQAGYSYDKAFQNTVALVKHLMSETGIPASHVVQHYDVCAKNCPSQIRKKGDWSRLKNLISGGSAAPAQSAPVQNSSGKIVLKVDGLWGGDTTQRLQHYFGLSQDRTISNQLNAYKRYCPGIVSAEWSNTPNGGSMLVRKMQQWLGVKKDGYIGSGFNCALQRKFGMAEDGVLSHPSQCITALQVWLNKQR